MTAAMWVEFFLLLALTVVLAWLAACWDIARIQREARKRAEHERVLDLLRRQ